MDPRVLTAYVKALEDNLGNPSSIHCEGKRAKRLLDQCHQLIADIFRVKPYEVIFTSGGTEGAALLIQGLLQKETSAHAISSVAEHASVYQNLKAWEKRGGAVSFLPTGEWGAVSPDDVERAIQPNTRLIALMAANNETGVLTDIPKIASIAEKAAIPLIVDGVAWLGKEPISLPSGVSAMFFSGHKIYGPKGVGFCVCRHSLKLTPLFHGGGQEFQRRPGTENLPGIAALAHAVSLLPSEQESLEQIRKLRDRFEQEVLSRVPDTVVNGQGPRLCNTSNLSFLRTDGETLLMNLDMQGLSASHGSACSSGALEPSRILLGMGLSLQRARSAIRFSLGRMTTEEDVIQAVHIIQRLCSS